MTPKQREPAQLLYILREPVENCSIKTSFQFIRAFHLQMDRTCQEQVCSTGAGILIIARGDEQYDLTPFREQRLCAAFEKKSPAHFLMSKASTTFHQLHPAKLQYLYSNYPQRPVTLPGSLQVVLLQNWPRQNQVHPFLLFQITNPEFLIIVQ